VSEYHITIRKREKEREGEREREKGGDNNYKMLLFAIPLNFIRCSNNLIKKIL